MIPRAFVHALERTLTGFCTRVSRAAAEKILTTARDNFKVSNAVEARFKSSAYYEKIIMQILLLKKYDSYS